VLEKLTAYEPALTDDMYSILSSKSVFLTSTVSFNKDSKGRPENVTVQYGPLLIVLVHSRITSLLRVKGCESLLYLPVSHAIQELTPVAAEYVPARQWTHVPALAAPITLE